MASAILSLGCPARPSKNPSMRAVARYGMLVLRKLSTEGKNSSRLKMGVLAAGGRLGVMVGS